MFQYLIVGTKEGAEWVQRLRKEKDGRRIEIKDKLDENTLQDFLLHQQAQPEECLCIVETDVAAKAALELNMPCIAYCNPKIPEQAFGGIKLLLEGFEEVDWQFLENVHTRALGLPVTIAETKRLLIREMMLADLDLLYELYEDPEIRQFVSPFDEDREAERERVKAYIEYMYGLYQYGMWVVIEKESGKLIGRAGYGIADYTGKSELDLGYVIGKAWRGRGYAYEACKAVLDYGRTVLGFPQVAAYVHVENVPSLNLLRKLGFEVREEVEHEDRKMYRWVKEWATVDK